MNLNDLGTTPLNDGVDVANLPEQMGSFGPMVQPGAYRFQLPKLGPENFDAVESKDHGKRVRVKFDEKTPLLIVQAPPAFSDEFLNTAFRTQISNVPRRRGKAENAPVASDWDYLNRALGETTRPANNAEYAKALIARSQQNPPAQFTADVEVSYSCNPNRAARFDDGQGGTTEVTDPATGAIINGCGERVYQSAVAKVEGRYPERIVCPKCNASLRGFPDLTRFRAE